MLKELQINRIAFFVHSFAKSKNFNTPFKMQWIKFITTFLFFSSSLSFSNPFFDGNVRYQYSNGNREVTLSHDKISNSSNEITTGTIRISLWATDYHYQGGHLEGTRIASYKLGPLKPNQWWKAMDKKLPAAPPPYDGNFYLTMTTEEYTNDGYRLIDWIAFDKQAYLSKPKPPPAKPRKLLSMNGGYRWQTYPSKNTLEIGTGKIQHSRNGQTGSLKITVWATPNRYNGGTINGFILGSVQKEPLRKGNIYPHINATVPYSPPPLGKFYYITITLAEYDGNGYKTMDYFTFDNGSWF